MALIEHLERDNWREFLRDTFKYTLDVLNNDRFRSVGSAADDLRSWLVAGGLPRVKEHLNRQMEMRRFSEACRAEVHQFLEQLARENRGLLLELTVKGVLPSTSQDGFSAYSFTESQLAD